MKKVSLIAFAMLVLSFKTTEEKKYAVSLTVQQWEMVVNVIEQSNAPYQQVKAVQNLLIPVLNKQITDTTKK